MPKPATLPANGASKSENGIDPLEQKKHDKENTLIVTTHGFRSTFRDWAAETTEHPWEVCEYALAHKLADKVEASYQRSDLLVKRTRLMADWSRYCGTTE